MKVLKTDALTKIYGEGENKVTVSAQLICPLEVNVFCQGQAL